MTRFCNVLAVLALSISAGCGGPGVEKPPLAPVTGTVTFKGQPLPTGEVVFQPAEGRPAHGVIENGQISSVQTYEPGDGAPVGDLKVAIFATESDSSDPSGMGVKSLIPEKYNDATKSGLTAKVEAGQDNNVELKLTE
jgi:hypothetical protein